MWWVGRALSLRCWVENYVPDSTPVPADEAGEWRVEVTGESPEELFLNLLSVTGHGCASCRNAGDDC